MPKKSESIAILRARLEDALQSGKCDELPVDLGEEEERLNKQFLESNAAERNRRHLEAEAERNRRYLEAGRTEEAKAAKDPGLFLRDKFLSGDGNERLCVLKLDRVDRARVHEAAGILGLFTVSADAPDGGRWIVAGKDRAQVSSEMLRIRADTAEVKAQEKASKRLKIEQLHERFLAADASNVASHGNAAELVGQWHILCEYIETQWSEGGPLSLSIFQKSGKLRANFDFRVIEGVMKLNEQTPAGNIVNKKLQFRWRGSETGEGEILFMDDRQKGYIVLEGKGKLSGRIKGDLLDDKCFFTGVKMNNKPAKTDAEWDEYDFSAHERARIGRWH